MSIFLHKLKVNILVIQNVQNDSVVLEFSVDKTWRAAYVCQCPVLVERGYACSTIAVKYLACCIHKKHDKNKPDKLRSS